MELLCLAGRALGFLGAAAILMSSASRILKKLAEVLDAGSRTARAIVDLMSIVSPALPVPA